MKGVRTSNFFVPIFEIIDCLMFPVSAPCTGHGVDGPTVS